MVTCRQVCQVFVAVLFLSLVGSSWQEELLDNAVSPTDYARVPPLAVISSDEPLRLAKSTTKVPLLTIPQKNLHIMKDADITAISPDNAIVQCFNERTGLTEAMPAVKMQLKRPVMLNARKGRAVVDFPSFINVAYRGSLVPLPVGALIAPVNYQQLNQPFLVKTVYAVPTFPSSYQYAAPVTPSVYTQPYLYQPYNLPYNYYTQPLQSYINYRPYGNLQPISNSEKPVIPLQPGVAAPTIKQPASDYQYGAAIAQTAAEPQANRPLVTVLDFPESVANPSVLYYQPPISSDSEFENREPPQPVIPAGIIQSTAPQPNQQLFSNSKESVYLLSIKEDQKKH